MSTFRYGYPPLADRDRYMSDVDVLRRRLAEVEEALQDCGIVGIYDEFAGPGDAIRQMAAYIIEHDSGDGRGWRPRHVLEERTEP